MMYAEKQVHNDGSDGSQNQTSLSHNKGQLFRTENIILFTQKVVILWDYVSTRFAGVSYCAFLQDRDQILKELGGIKVTLKKDISHNLNNWQIRDKAQMPSVCFHFFFFNYGTPEDFLMNEIKAVIKTKACHRVWWGNG